MAEIDWRPVETAPKDGYYFHARCALGAGPFEDIEYFCPAVWDDKAGEFLVLFNKFEWADAIGWYPYPFLCR